MKNHDNYESNAYKIRYTPSRKGMNFNVDVILRNCSSFHFIV